MGGAMDDQLLNVDLLKVYIFPDYLEEEKMLYFPLWFLL